MGLTGRRSYSPITFFNYVLSPCALKVGGGGRGVPSYVHSGPEAWCTSCRLPEGWDFKSGPWLYAQRTEHCLAHHIYLRAHFISKRTNEASLEIAEQLLTHEWIDQTTETVRRWVVAKGPWWKHVRDEQVDHGIFRRLVGGTLVMGIYDIMHLSKLTALYKEQTLLNYSRL